MSRFIHNLEYARAVQVLNIVNEVQGVTVVIFPTVCSIVREFEGNRGTTLDRVRNLTVISHACGTVHKVPVVASRYSCVGCNRKIFRISKHRSGRGNLRTYYALNLPVNVHLIVRIRNVRRREGNLITVFDFVINLRQAPNRRIFRLNELSLRFCKACVRTVKRCNHLLRLTPTFVFAFDMSSPNLYNVVNNLNFHRTCADIVVLIVEHVRRIVCFVEVRNAVRIETVCIIPRVVIKVIGKRTYFVAVFHVCNRTVVGRLIHNLEYACAVRILNVVNEVQGVTVVIFPTVCSIVGEFESNGSIPLPNVGNFPTISHACGTINKIPVVASRHGCVRCRSKIFRVRCSFACLRADGLIQGRKSAKRRKRCCKCQTSYTYFFDKSSFHRCFPPF